MPLYPAIAIVTVLALSRGYVAPRDLGAKLTALLMPFIPAGLAVGLAFAARPSTGACRWAGLASCFSPTLVAFAAWWPSSATTRPRRRSSRVARRRSSLVGVFGFTQPVLQSLRLSPRLAEAARGARLPDPALGNARLPRAEPRVPGRNRAADVRAAPRRRPSSQRRRLPPRLRREPLRGPFREEAGGPGSARRSRRGVSGFNINGGRRVDIGAYAVSP